MRQLTPKFVILALLVGGFSLASTTACSDDPDGEVENDLDNGDDVQIPRCEAETWDCDEFVDGADLSIDRFNQDTVILNDELALLFGGSEYLEGGGARGAHSWEVFNYVEDEVHVEATDFEEIRRNPSVIQLDTGQPVVVGGRNSDGDQMRSVKLFSLSQMDWIELESMNAPYRQARLLDDGQILAMGFVHGTSQEAVEVVGQVFDPDELEWSRIASAQLPDNQVGDYSFEQGPEGDIVLAYANYAPPADQPDEDEFPMDGVTVYETTVVSYDFEAGEIEVLEHFDELQTLGFSYDLVWLPASERFLIHMYTEEYDSDDFAIVDGETTAYLYDPASGDFDHQYDRDPSPGAVLEVLPRDTLLYQGSSQAQFHEVDSGAWFDFIQMPDGIYYSTMNLLGDCQLFVAGERRHSGERRGVHTGYCEPN